MITWPDELGSALTKANAELNAALEAYSLAAKREADAKAAIDALELNDRFLFVYAADPASGKPYATNEKMRADEVADSFAHDPMHIDLHATHQDAQEAARVGRVAYETASNTWRTLRALCALHEAVLRRPE